MLLTLTIVITYFVWAYVHEYSHLLVLKHFKHVKSYTIKVYPHYSPSLGFVFAEVSYDYDGTLTEYELGVVSIAPRVADLLAVILLALGTWDVYLLILLGGGVVDLLRGSYSRHPESDINRYCRAFKWDVRAVTCIQVITALLALFLSSR